MSVQVGTLLFLGNVSYICSGWHYVAFQEIFSYTYIKVGTLLQTIF